MEVFTIFLKRSVVSCVSRFRDLDGYRKYDLARCRDFDVSLALQMKKLRFREMK